ncbi:serine/threonine-protein kinase [Calothrix sp. PCC 6303]|uniref:serine/threonine-protein kinase n=1 Tax=Calothrix sp. PCC 6303 TaxID=1170562 RepID=UPI0002A056F8|nr:serine/threonine-protein kinase [Calothrix sp. PCC 6303]AFZ04017.1 serine/threonine protein kinase [Calothrix sp. PCC 6303]
MYWQPGHKLNNQKYTIEMMLGQGAFGVTYKARNSQINLPVVIKTPNPMLQRDRNYSRFVGKFIQEAQLLGQLSTNPHPNIVRVIDYFEEGSNTPCLVMEYIAGQDLFQLIEPQNGKLNPLPENVAVNYILKIGDALISMHENSTVHRDIHPGNLMIRSNKQPMLIDFGLAGDITPATSFSRSFGNQNFAPYEQFQGRKEPTVDIYGLAATLYYAVTGEYPVSSCDRKYYQAELISPQQIVSSLSQSCCDAILKGMALEAKERSQTMQEWVDLFVAQPKIAQSNNSKALKLLNSHLEPGQAQIIQGDYSKALELANNYINKENLTSEVGVDYTNLSDLLKAQNWREADEETGRLMLKVANQKREGYLGVESINNFPCADLRTIDQLWVKYSNGRFGFSVQKRIYQSLGGTEEYNDKIWNAFGDRIGWKRGKKWVYYSDITFSLSQAPEAHLPWKPIWCGVYDGMVYYNWKSFSLLASRLVKSSI